MKHTTNGTRLHATAAGVLGLLLEKEQTDRIVAAKVAALFPVGEHVVVPRRYSCGGMLGTVAGYLSNRADVVRVTVERGERGAARPLVYTVDVLAKDLIDANAG